MSDPQIIWVGEPSGCGSCGGSTHQDTQPQPPQPMCCGNCRRVTPSLTDGLCWGCFKQTQFD